MTNHSFVSSFKTLRSNFIVLFACGSWAKNTYIEKRKGFSYLNFHFNLGRLARSVLGKIILGLELVFLEILLKMDL